MKKILAIVLALVMVCTLAMAAGIGDNEADAIAHADKNVTYTLEKATGAYKDHAATYLLKVTTKHTDGTTTVAYADGYYALTDEKTADTVIVDGKKFTYLLAVTNTGDDVKYKDELTVVKTIKEDDADKAVCGDVWADDDVAVYTDGTDYFVNDAAGDLYLVNGMLIQASKATVGAGVVDKKSHAYKVDTQTVGDKTTATKVYCNVKGCEKVFTFVVGDKADAVKAFGLGNYEDTGEMVGLDKVYVSTAAATTTTTTNPDTGANDVIGVAAALAVVALVSGAAISLKK